MMDAWSRRIEKTLSVRLDEQTRNWFDFAAHTYDWCGEFDEPLQQDESFEPLIRALWPGLMMPDLVPVIGNRYGDWYCLRIDADSSVRDIVHWYHGGGDIISVGNSLAEALLYDLCKSSVPGRTNWTERKTAQTPTLHGIHWIAQQLECDPSELESITQAFRSGEPQSGLLMLKHKGWCTAAVHRDLVSLAIESPFATFSDRSLAERLQVSWERDMQRWFFDTRTIPDFHRASIEDWFASNGSRLNTSDSQPLRDYPSVFANNTLHDSNNVFSQDWQAVESYCREMIAFETRKGAQNDEPLGTQEAWPYHLAGWAAWQNQQESTAIDYWWRGLTCSVFGDQSVAVRTHWFNQEMLKFSASQLVGLNLSNDRQQDRYWQLYSDQTNSPKEKIQRLHAYWKDKALATSNPSDAYRFWFAMGWDVGGTSMQLYRDVLSNLRDAAMEGGHVGRASLAALHCQKLQRRKG